MSTATQTTDDEAQTTGQRPDFLDLCRHHEAGAVVERYADEIRQSLSTVTDGGVEAVWLQGQSCTGCTVSLLQSEFPAIEETLGELREAVSFHPTLMEAAGDEAMDALGADPDLLIVEGSVPVEVPRAATLGRDDRGEPKPVVDWVIELAEAADLVVAVGSCSAYGGLPAAGRHDSEDVGADPTGARGLQFDGREPGGVFGPEFRAGSGLPVVNVPGCPAHPDHVLLTLGTVLNGHAPALDEFNRPLPVFGPLVHDDCSLREEYEAGNFADEPGDDGCLYDAGCAGVYAYCDDSKRLRNGGTTICRDVGAPCIGCVEPAFWDRFTPFYGPGDDDGCAGYDTPAVRADSDAAAHPEMRAVGVATSAAAACLAALLLPAAAVGTALVRLAGVDGRDPTRTRATDDA